MFSLRWVAANAPLSVRSAWVLSKCLISSTLRTASNRMLLSAQATSSTVREKMQRLLKSMTIRETNT
jgi:hypothetical protein